MNITHAILERQSGNNFWKEYDIAIQRLKCLKINEYHGITRRVDDLNLSDDSPILACKFSRTAGYEDLVALANENGNFAIHSTETNDRWNSKHILAHHNAIFDIEWLSNDTRIVSASGDYSVRLWNITESEIISEMVYLGHSRSVKSVTSSYRDPNIFASGARDGIIILWDRRSQVGSDLVPRPDNIIRYSSGLTPKSKSKSLKFLSGNPITGLVYQDDYTLISCTASDGLISVWDTRKSYSFAKRAPVPKYTIPYTGSSFHNGFSNLLVDHNSMKLYASCLDNVIYCYNISTYNSTPIMRYVGHQIHNSFYVKSSLSPDGLYLISGGGDGKAYIWNIKNKSPLVHLKGHDAEVTCVAWCQKENVKIVTCSDDSKQKIWCIGPEFIDRDLDITGHAEIVEEKLSICSYSPLNCHKRILPITEETPKSGCSSRKQRCMVCSICSSRSRDINCENCLNNFNDNLVNSSKRKNSDNYIHGESSKRARRLFSSSHDEQIDCSKTNVLATILEPAEEILPNNSSIDTICVQPASSCFSPTTNLPNFAIDGTAPHLSIISPQKRHKSCNDWLTQIRKEKEFMQSYSENLEASSPKMIKLDPSVLVNSPKTPKRKVKNSVTEKTPKSSNNVISQSPLLKFFKITASKTVNRTDNMDQK